MSGATRPTTVDLGGAGWTVRPLVDDSFGVPRDGIPAQVPGDVHDDLMVAGLLAPLEHGSGDPRWLEVGRTGWVYRRTVAIPAFAPGERAHLVFDGVDFSCRVRVDGVEVGANSGMFRRFVVEITDAVSPGASAQLEVEIDAMPAGLEEGLRGSDGALSGGGGPDFFVFVNNRIRRALKDLKSPTVTSYDWAVNTWTTGIWRDVALVVTGPSRIEDLRTDVEWASGVPVCRLSAVVDGGADHAPVVRFTVRDPDDALVAEGTAVSEEGFATIALAVPEPRLWWPVGYGDHPLYTVIAEVVRDGEAQRDDRASRRIGLRRIEWTQVEGVPDDFINPFRLLVNGVPVRMMGSSMVPPDLLYGRIGRHGPWVVHALLAARLNTIRLWGGGVLLPDSMYDLADEQGLLIIQEFFLANCRPEEDPEFLDNLDATLRNVVRRIRHHPSIIEWGGGNEMNWAQADDLPALRVMRDVVASEDDRIFRATCPMEGSNHSPWIFDPAVHYAHYDDPALTDVSGLMPLQRYGEFGAPSPAYLEVWERDAPAASRWPIDSGDDPILVRKNATSSAFNDEHWLILTLVEELFGVSRSLRDLIRAGQLLGAEGLRYAVDALRRRGPRLGGFLTWVLNEPWPNLAGDFLVDYDGRPMPSHGFLRQAMAPVALSLRYDALLHPAGSEVPLELVVVSDAAAFEQGLRWSVASFSLEGARLGGYDGDLEDIAPGEVRELGPVPIRMPEDGAPLFVQVRLFDAAGETLQERLHVFGAKGTAAPFSALLPDGRFPAPEGVPTAGIDPSSPDNLAAASNGGRIVAISGVEDRDFDPAAALIDGRYMSTVDSFVNAEYWVSPTEEGWVELELAREADVNRLCVGRDRSGSTTDRILDRLRVEVSPDGVEWTEVADVDHLASLLGDRVTTGPTLRPPTRPTWTLDLRFPAHRTRRVRVHARGREGNRDFAAFDEIEVYADPAVDVLETEFIVRDRRETDHRLPRTTLVASTIRSGIDAATEFEILWIRVANVGTALALMCEVTADGEYQPRVLTDMGAISIPPGESRTIEIRTDPALSPSIDATGWRVSAWNADPVPVNDHPQPK